MITGANGKMYYQNADIAELDECRRRPSLSGIHQQIEALEASQARPLRELELIALGVMTETEDNVQFAVNKLQEIQVAIEALRHEHAELNERQSSTSQSLMSGVLASKARLGRSAL